MATGSIPKNFQEGARSEYLAQYIFSALGTAVLVPRPEDSGIDLKCTLGERKGNSFWVNNYYYVQVKSDEKEIVYDGRESVQWLLSLKLPLLICLINKKKQIVEIFQTIGMTSQFSNENLETLVFKFNGTRSSNNQVYRTSEKFPSIEGKKQRVEVDLGKPILKFSVSELSDHKNVELFKLALSSWVQLQQVNINNISLGFELFEIPDPWITNKPIPTARRFQGNLFSISEKNKRIYKDSLYKSLSTVLVEVGQKGNPEIFNEVRIAIGKVLENIENPFEMGTINLVYRENEIAKKLGLEPYIKHPMVNYSKSNPDV